MNTLELSKVLQTNHDHLKNFILRIGEGQEVFQVMNLHDQSLEETFKVDNITALYVMATYLGNLDHIASRNLFSIDSLLLKFNPDNLKADKFLEALEAMGYLQNDLVTIEGMKYGRINISTFDPCWYNYLFGELYEEVSAYLNMYKEVLGANSEDWEGSGDPDDAA